MIQEGGSTPVMVSGGGYGGDGCGWGGGLMGIILIIALLSGGLGFGGFGRRDGCGDHNDHYSFALQRDVLDNKFVSEKNTAALMHNQDMCTQRILDRMCNDREFALMGRINEAERLLSEQRIVCAVKAEAFPQRAVPAYMVPPPFGFDNRGCGFPGDVPGFRAL